MSIHTKIVPIINITPDSFSDGGKYSSLGNIKKEFEKIKNLNINFVDIGGQSTRPNATIISEKEEWNRLEPVIKVACEIFNDESDVISIDTYHPETAEKAIKLGANCINDVSGAMNKDMVKLAVDNDVLLIFMHNLGIPANPLLTIPESEDPIKIVKNWAKNKIDELINLGVNLDKLIFDPGIGFGKTKEQSFLLIKEIDKFIDMGVKIMVGHSRKSFLSLFTDLPFSERDIETLSISTYLFDKKVDFIRVHNYAYHQRFLNLYNQLSN